MQPEHRVKRTTIRAKISFMAWSLFIGLALLSGQTVFPPRAHAEQERQKTTLTERTYEKALISFHNKKIKEATIHLKNALKANPRHLPSRILMAEILIEQGDGAGAEVELNFARERGAGNDRLVILFGKSYFLQGKYDYLLKVIHNGNRDLNIEAEISFLRGRAYFANKKLANAKRSYTDALQKKPALYEARLGLAQVAAVYKQYGRALQHIDAALTSPEPMAGAWILKAKIYKLQGFQKEAVTAINQALAIDDSNPLSRLTRAALYIQEREFDLAEKDVDYILGQIPREPRANYLKAIINAGQGDYSTSDSNMTEVINILRSVPPEVMNTNPTYYYLSGLTNFQYGNLDEARENLQKYLKIERNDITAMRLLGALELKARQPIAATIILLKANQAQSGNPTILTLLGLAYLELGNIDKANYYLERVTEIVPESSQGLTNLARGNMAAQSYDLAIDNLLKAEKHNLKSLDVKLMLISAYQQSGQEEKAFEITRSLLQQQPDEPFFLNLHGTAAGLAGKHRLARESYEKAFRIDPENTPSLIYLSRIYMIEGDSPKAINNLRTQLDKKPDNYVLMHELGNIYRRLDDAEKALFWYKKAYSIDNKDFSILNSLVDGYMMTGDTRAALEATTEYITRFPKEAEAYTLSGRLYEQAGKPVEAIKNFKLAVKYVINQGPALLTLSAAQLKINDRSSARKSLQKAITWDPNSTSAYIALIKMAIEDVDSKNALALLDNLRRISGKTSPAADILAGDLYLALKDSKKAATFYRAALKLGDNPVPVLGLYKAYMSSGQPEKAVTTLEGWHEKYPEDIRTALALGNAYKQKGQIKKAADFHEKLLSENPDMPIILNNAANLNFMVGNKKKALEYARKANRFMPGDATVMDTLAWIESRSGNPEVALPLLRKALVLRFSNPEIKYHLAITLDKLDRRGEALKLLSEIATARNNFPEIETARQTLKDWTNN